MIRLETIDVHMAADRETVLANIRRNLSRELPQAHELPEWREAAPIAVIGGGPSLAETIGEAKRYVNAMLCGSVHDYAVGEGLRPRWTVVCDPDPVMANYLTRPRLGCRYLVASHCDAAVFEALRGFDVAVWHCAGGIEAIDPVWTGHEVVLVGGGCTVGLRGVVLAKIFGFTNIHLFGMDTCLAENKHHAYDFSSPGEEELCVKGKTEVTIGSETGNTFVMSGYMIGQMVGFKEILNLYADKVEFTVHGGGVLDELLRLGREDAQRREAA